MEYLLKVRHHLFIHGDVQGVGFRYFARRIARSLRLTGWVRNLPDGRVEVVFEGEREDVERAALYCKEGPPMATVSKIDVVEEEAEEEETDFRIIM